MKYLSNGYCYDRCLECLKYSAKCYSIDLLHADYSQGFGGKFGVQSDRQDKSAAGWDHIEKVEKHESQKGELLVFTSC